MIFHVQFLTHTCGSSFVPLSLSLSLINHWPLCTDQMDSWVWIQNQIRGFRVLSSLLNPTEVNSGIEPLIVFLSKLKIMPKKSKDEDRKQENGAHIISASTVYSQPWWRGNGNNVMPSPMEHINSAATMGVIPPKLMVMVAIKNHMLLLPNNLAWMVIMCENSSILSKFLL